MATTAPNVITQHYRFTLNDLRLITRGPAESPRWLGGGLDEPKGFAPQGRAANGVAASQPLQWSSEFTDTDLGLVYYNYRHYNPLDGRWCGRDPIAEEGGYNLYTYLSNRATHLIDEKGMGAMGPTLLFDLINGLISSAAGYHMGDCVKKYPPVTKQNESSCMACVNAWTAIAAASQNAAYVLIMGTCAVSTGGWGLFLCVSLATTSLAYAFATLGKERDEMLEQCKCKS